MHATEHPGAAGSWDPIAPFLTPGIRLRDLDEALAAKYRGTAYELRASGRPVVIEARAVPVEEHEHIWSLPIDELRGRRVCKFRGCGHIATRSEMFRVFLARKKREGRRA